MNTRLHPLLRSALVSAALGCSALIPTASLAQEAMPSGIEAVAPRLLFVVSGGYWEGEIAPLQTIEAAAGAEPTAEAAKPATPEAPATDAAASTKPADAPAAEAPAAPAVVARGFYRLVVLRSDDNSSRVHLQRFALSPEGPKLVDGRELEEISSLPAYVTDARSEDTSSVSNQPGFAVFITLKTDPSIVERETWTVFVDEFGEVEVNRATN